MPSVADIEHLLRRTEFVARPQRVAELQNRSLEAAVDDVMAVSGDLGGMSFASNSYWEQGHEYTHFWFDRMAHDSPRPFQERMALFWHGHFCTSLNTVGSAPLMKQQIDRFRSHGLGYLGEIAKTVSTQPAMLRYLNNNENRKLSPNQNFARELMELFLLGVGNYNEDDVEASAAAWTGHADDAATGVYRWVADWHDPSPKALLGTTINRGPDWSYHGPEVIDVILGSGVVPADAANGANRGRPTRDVTAEFISRKLWLEFAGPEPSPAVLQYLAGVARANSFALTPWVKAMLTHPEFYSEASKQGKVRSPAEFTVAMLVALDLRSAVGTPIWLYDGMGQRLLHPPDVSGWRHNSYWLSPGAMLSRTTAVRSSMWHAMPGYMDGDQLIHLQLGSVSRQELEGALQAQPAAVVDRFAQLMNIHLSAHTREVLVHHSTVAGYWERIDLIPLMLLTPDFQAA